MVLSAAWRKSVSDLTRRPARAFFAVVALALAVASIGLFALPALMNSAMNREIAANLLPELTISIKPTPLTNAQLAALGRLPNVAAIDAGTMYLTRVYVGARRQQAFVIGKPSFTHQTADVVTVTAGSVPPPGAVLTDVQNAAYGRNVGSIGGSVRVVAGDGRVVSMPISGVGRNLLGEELIAQNGFAILYATEQTVARLSGTPGFTVLGFRLHDPSPLAAGRTVATIRRYLATVPGFQGFSDLPQRQAPGDWPGKSRFDHFVNVLYVITLLALLCALVLVSNTMSTLIGEQTPEIATMKAIGAGRRQVRGVYLRTAALLGVIGGILGALLGVLVSYGLVSFFAASLYDTSAPFGVDAPVLVASILVGMIGPVLAALPAIRRATRMPLAESLRATGSAVGGQAGLDRLVRRARFLPRTAQIGLRGVTRRKRRSAGTVLQVAFAVGTLLALLSLAASVTRTVQASWNSYGWDIWAQAPMNQPLPHDAAQLIESTPGVRRAQPVLVNGVQIRGQAGDAWGLPASPMYTFHLVAGRLYTAAEARAGARVVVVEQSIATATGTHVGQRVQLGTAAGPVELTVIGIVADQQNNGTVLFVPLSTLQAVLHVPGDVNGYWIQATSPNPGVIDRTNTRLENAFAAHGVQLTTMIKYVGEQSDVAAYRGVTTAVTALGTLIVAISMVGLINAITMAVLERSREIGMLRCIGGRGRDVRRIFATEGLTLALAGWLIGLPLGFALARGIVKLTGTAVNQHLLFAFPPAYIPIALVGTLVLALLVMLAPLHRAVAFRPGDALRYA